MNKEKKIAITGILIILLISIVTTIEFNLLSGDISKLESEKKYLQNLVKDKNDDLNTVTSQISYTNSQINQIKNNLNEAVDELELLRSGKRYNLRNPTYSEVISFIASDRTNYERYDEDTFNCAHYARGVNNNSEAKGIRCGYVAVNLSVSAHALVAFNTTDKGIIYYEPQSDEKVNLQVGKDYWADCVVERGSYYYLRNSDNVIQDFTIFW
jgi:hypothetical protein